MGVGTLHSTDVAYLLGTQEPLFDSLYSQKLSEEKLSMLLRLINSKVDSGLKMLIETLLVLASGKPILQKKLTWAEGIPKI